MKSEFFKRIIPKNLLLKVQKSDSTNKKIVRWLAHNLDELFKIIKNTYTEATE